MEVTTIVVVTVETVERGSPVEAPEAGRVIVPLDRSERSQLALTPAVELARRTGARLQLLTTELSEGPVSSRSFLDEIAARLGGIETNTITTEEADPVAAIREAVQDGPAPTTIVMSSHGRGGITKAVMGSVTEGVVNDGAAPVIVVGPEFDPDAFDPEGPVILGHDGSHEPDAEAIARLAQASDGRVAVVEVIVPPLLRSGESEGADIRPASDDVQASADRLRDLGLSVTAQARRGPDPVDVILSEANRIEASYLAVTTRANTGARRLILGSISSRLVSSSPLPVLITHSPD